VPAPTPPTSESPPPAVVAPVETVNRYLDDYTAGLALPPNLVEAIRYSLLGPGKRLRPLLAWHACVAAGGTGEGSLAPGAAVELIHAFSLVHDDLPGMDDDDLRRGRPTLHRHTSEAMAILAGDAMLTLAVQILVERVEPRELSAALVRELIDGTTAMIAGQVYDTLGGFPPGTTDDQRLETIHRNKTGALIRAACRMGALTPLGTRADDAARRTLDAISRYADDIGLMFQIVDDVLDVTQTTAHIGKRSGKDQQAGKLTFPGVHGLEESRRQVRKLLDDSLAAIAPLGPPAEPLRQLASYLAVRTR
jgi:geranylgeranyl pyrophosphate synthase